VTCTYLDRDLDAYVDGELAAEADAAVRAHVDGCADCAARVSERQGLARALRALPYYEAPASMRARISGRASRTRSRRALGLIAAAAVVVLAAARGAALLTPGPNTAADSVQALVDGHVRSLMADHLFDVRSTDQHTVKPWFIGKLDFSPPVVDLAAQGYPLVGGRVDYVGGHQVAALVYQRRQHVINLFVAPSTGATAAPAAQSVRGFHVRRWTSGGMSFSAVSDLNDAELDTFVKTLQSP
jgi:anti-sigma factor RsiW